MTELGAILLFSWIPLVLVIFAALPPRQAVIFTFLTAYLFLPELRYPISGLPEFSKSSATAYGLALAILIFDNTRLARFRPSLLDIPILIYIMVDIPTSLTNGLGIYDGFTRSLGLAIEVGIPWVVGRLYFNDLEGLRELAKAIFISGLIYVPLCQFEIRFSPQLHNLVYGDHVHEFQQTIRFGGYRPTVFMRHGLLVGLWMSWATLCGIWLYATGTLKSLGGIPLYLLIIPLAITTVMCKSTGALGLLLVGCAILVWMKYAGASRATWPLYAIAGCVCGYLGVRVTGIWHGEQLVSLAESIVGGDRAHSLGYRLANERILTEHAARRMLLGWGSWDRNRPPDSRVVTDSLWIIVFGINGIVGLAGFVGMMLGPPLLLARRVSTKLWMHPAVSVAPLFATITVLTMVDLLLNSGYAPVLRAAMGGLAGFQVVKATQTTSWAAMVARMRAAGAAQTPQETPTQRAARRRQAAKSGGKGRQPTFEWPENKRDAP